MKTTIDAPVTAPTTVPAKAPTTPEVPVTPDAPPAWVMPDVWHEKATGMPWCECGDDCPLTLRYIATCADNVVGKAGANRMTHKQVILTAMDVWAYSSVCRFFTMAIEDAAVRVNGEVAEDYPKHVGLVIVKGFSNKWNGCPEQACNDDWTPNDINDGCFDEG